MTGAGSTTAVNVFLLRNGNMYKIKTVKPDLTVFVSTYTSPVPTQLLGVYENFFFVRENTSATDFNYAIYYTNVSNILFTALIRNTIPQPVLAGNRTGLTFSKFLSFA
jgi:hypothetical protein